MQDGRDFADVVSPKLATMFGLAVENRYYLHVIQHLVEGDTGVLFGCSTKMQPCPLRFSPSTFSVSLQLLGLESIAT